MRKLHYYENTIIKKNKKAIVTLISSIFIFGAFTPTLNSIGNNNTLCIQFEEVESQQKINNEFEPLDFSDPWWNDGWLYRKEIIINYENVDTNLTNFPVLISISSDNDLSNSNKCQDDADDVVFTNDSGNKLNHEIEYFDNNTGELICWVNVTHLSNVTNTSLYLYYGNSSCSNQENVENTWNNDFKSVWHLNHTSGDAIDSTSNNNDGTEYISPDSNMNASGIIDGADSFDGTDDYIGIDGSLLPTGSQLRTISAWVKTTDEGVNPNGNCILGYGNQATGQEVLLTVENNYVWWRVHGGNRNWTATDVNDGNWHYLVYILNGTQTDDMIAYMDGNVLSVASYVSQTLNTASTSNGDIGRRVNSDTWLFTGDIDEIRVLDVACSEGWVTTSYKNQNNPSNFYSIGDEEANLREPVLSNPIPSNGSQNVELTPTLSIDVFDYQNDSMNVYFRTNASTGVWHTIGENLSVYRDTVSCNNTAEMNTPETMYWWSVNVTDPLGSGNWTNETYHFTTVELLSNWGYRELLTIDHTKVSGDLTDFPILVDITHSGLKNNAQPDGDDILFTNESTGWSDPINSRFSHEIEYYDSSSGHLVSWVKLPVLTDTIDTSFYMYYGNPDCTSQENANEVWDSNYKMVQHLNETTGDHYDSTSFGNDGTPSVTVQGSAAGKVDGADSFDGTDDYIQISDDDSLDITGNLTISAWVYPDSFADRSVILSKRIADDDREYEIRLYRIDSSSAQIRYLDSNNNVLSTGNIPVDQWSHVTVVRNSSSSTVLFYIDGIFDSSVGLSGTVSATDADVWIGRRSNEVFPFDGILDNIHISDIIRTADWIQTSYDNQESPQTFLSYGNPPIVTLISPANGTNVTNFVNFTYIPECFNSGEITQSELFFNITTYDEPELEWSNSGLSDMDRSLLRDNIVYAFRWTSGPTSIVVFNFSNGELIEESPTFGEINPSTAPTLDPTNQNVVYGISGDGVVVRYNVTSDLIEWETDISQTSSRTLWPCCFPYLNGDLYISFNNYSICKVNASNGNIIDWLLLDDGGNEQVEMQIPPRVDINEGVLYVQDATSLRKINATDLSEIWNLTIGDDCLLVQTGAYSSRFIPMLVNDSFTENEPWIITECAADSKIFAINSSGFEVWNQSLDSRIRAMPNYHPDRGWIYLNKFTFTDGKVYVLNITDGSFLFNFTYPNNYPSNREMMLTKKYLISKTDRLSGVTDYLYIFNNKNGSLIGSVDIGTPRFHCDPLITSNGITMITHSPSNGGNAWRLGEGEYNDYYPFTGSNGYQYLENALTSYGITNETWGSRKVNESAVENGTLNGILYDFSTYSLPNTFRWNILVTDSNGYSNFSVNDRIVKIHKSMATDPNPSLGAINVELSPTLSVYLNDFQGENNMDVSFRTNASTEIWHDIGENISVGSGRVYCYNTSEINNPESKYWWSVNVTDNKGNWTNETYQFTTVELLSNWGYRELLTIDHTQVSGDLTDFPIFIDITHSGLKDNAQSDGDDILFTNESTNWDDPFDCKFPHEIEFYNSSTGHLMVWVKIPFLSSSDDTTLYMYYGNANSNNQENIHEVWDSNYKMVQHLNETIGNHYDSTSFGNDGTPSVTVQGSVAGKVDGADRFDGTDDYIQISDDDSLDITGNLTISAWVYPDSFAERNEIICKVVGTYEREFEVRLWRIDSSSAQIRFLDANNDVLSTGTVSVDQWSHITVVRNSSSSTVLFYIDGIFDSSGSLSGTVSPTDADVCIGTRCPPNEMFHFDGTIDEVKLSDTIRTLEWIQTSYNNQYSPTSFCYFGNPPIVTLISPSNGTNVTNPVNFTYIPECFTEEGCVQAELYFNISIFNEGGNNKWSNSNLVDMDRAVLRDNMAFGIHWTSGPCSIMVFNFTTGQIIHQSPVFGDRNPSTSPTLDPNNPDIVYGFSGDGEVVRYNMSSDSFEWETDISDTSNLVFWANFVPLYQNYLYLAYINCSLCQLDATNGDVLRWLELDSGISEMQFPPRVDEDHGVLYVQDATSLRKLNAADLSEIWSVDIGTNCLYVESGAYSSRFTPLLVNDSFTEDEPWIITECAADSKIFAINASGYEIWNTTIESKIRAMPCYHPDRGWMYLNKFTFTDGKVYVLNITDGAFVFNFTYPNNYPSNRPMMLTKEFLISKTDRGSGVTDYLYVFNNRNGSLVGSVDIGTQRFHCDPLITSAGYTLITHSYSDSVNLWKLGEGEYYDYNPYTGANGYQYLENALTRFGFFTEQWASRKINESPIINNTINNIDFDFSEYSLPNSFRWNIKLTDSNGISRFSNEDWNVYIKLPPINNPEPENGSKDVDLNPLLSIDVSDYQGSALDVTFKTNASTGVWHTIGENLSIINQRIYCSNTSEIIIPDTVYWWSVNATYGSGNWINKTYSFRTLFSLSNWQYRKEIIINHSQVAADLNNFPILIQITNDNDLVSHAQGDFDDVLFTDGSVNWLTDFPKDRLNHEIESYNSTTGNLTVWINVTHLSSYTDTILYMYYGNLDCENQENIVETWNSNYVAVLHLDETTGSHYDSTVNDNIGTPLNGVIQNELGIIDGADFFDGNDDIVDISADDSHDLYGNLTVSMWIKPEVTYDSSLSNHLVLLNRQQPENDDSFILLINYDGRLHLGSYGGNIQSTQDSWNADTWYHVVATYRNNLTGELYIDGVNEILSVDNYDSMSSVSRNIEIGDAPGDTYIGFNGVIDEVRILNEAVSNQWIMAEYSNQKNPSEFYTFGTEEQVSDAKNLYKIPVNPYWNLISLPFNESIEKTDIIVKYNDINYPWSNAISSNNEKGEPLILDLFFGWNISNYEIVNDLEPGYGYWMWAYYNCTLLVLNNVTEYGNSTLQESWNIMALPYTQSFTQQDIFIYYNVTDYSWENATGTNNEEGEPLILKFVYGWNEIQQLYMLTDTFYPGEGYWMYAYYGCMLKKGV